MAKATTKKAPAKATPDPEVASRQAFDDAMTKARAEVASETRADEYWRASTASAPSPAAPEQAPEPEEDLVEPQAEVEPDEQPVDDEEYNLAVKALVNDGWTVDDIQDLDREKAIRVGRKRAKNQADVSARLQANAESASVSTQEDPEPVAKAPEVDLGKLLDPSNLDTPEKVAQTLKALVEATQGQTETVLKQVQDKLRAQEQASQATVQAAVDKARRDLAQELPELSDDSVWEAVRSNMAVLAQAPKYKAIPDTEVIPLLVRDAYTLNGFEVKALKESVDATADVRGRSSPTAPRRTAKKQLSPAEADRAAFNQIKKERGF